jgi:hypothetical protein
MSVLPNYERERDDSADKFCGLWEGIFQNRSSCIIKTGHDKYEVWNRDNPYLLTPYRKMFDAHTTTINGVQKFVITTKNTIVREYVLFSDIDKNIKNGEDILFPNINTSFFNRFIGNKIASPGFDYNSNNSIRFLDNLNDEITKNYRNRSLNLDTMTSFKDLWKIFRDLNLKVNTGNRYMTDVFSGEVVNINRFQKNFLDLFAMWEKSANSIIEYKYKINQIITHKINSRDKYNFINLIKNKKFYIIVNFEPKVNEVCKIIPALSRVKTNIFNNDELNNFNFRTAGHFNNGMIGSSFVTPKKIDTTFQIALRSPLHIENSSYITLKIKSKKYSIKIESGFYYLDELASVINEKIIKNGIMNITIIFVNRFNLLTGNNMNYEVLTTFDANDFEFHIESPKLKKVLNLDELSFIDKLDQKYVNYNHFRTIKNIKHRHCYSDLSCFIKKDINKNTNDSTIMTSIGNGHFPENHWSFIETVASLNFESNIEEHHDLRVRYMYDFNGELLIPDNKIYDIYFNNNFNNLDTYRIIYTSPMSNFCLSISPSINDFTTLRLGARSSLTSTVSILGKKNLSKLRNNFGYLFKNYLEKTYQFQYKYFLYKKDGNETVLSLNKYDFFEFDENQQELTPVTDDNILKVLTSKLKSILSKRISTTSNSSENLYITIRDVDFDNLQRITVEIISTDDTKSTFTISFNDDNNTIDNNVSFDMDELLFKINFDISLTNLSSVSFSATKNDDNFQEMYTDNLFYAQICSADGIALFERYINVLTDQILKQEIVDEISSSTYIIENIENKNFYERTNVPQPAFKAGMIKKNIIKNILNKSSSTSVSSNVNVLYYYLACLILTNYSQHIRSALIRLSKKLEIDHVIADLRNCRGGRFEFDYSPFGFDKNAGIKLIDNINYFSSYTAPSKNLNYVSTFNSLDYLNKLVSNSDSSTNKNLIAQTLMIVPSIRKFYYNIDGETYTNNTSSFNTSSNPSRMNEFYNKNDKMNISMLFDVNSVSAARSCHNILNSSINDKNQTRELQIDDGGNKIKYNNSRYFLVGEVEGLFATSSTGWPQSNFPDENNANIKFSIKNAINPTSTPISLRVRPQLAESLVSENGIKAGADDYNSNVYKLDRLITTSYNDFMFNVGLSKNKYTNIDKKSSFRDLSLERTLLITLTGNKNVHFSYLENIDIFSKKV